MLRAQSQQPLPPTASLLANNTQNGGDVSANADANKESVPDIDPTISQEEEQVKKQKKEALIYSRPGLDSTAVSNDSAVSAQDSDAVGAAQERIPASDKSRTSFIDPTIPQETEKVKNASKRPRISP